MPSPRVAKPDNLVLETAKDVAISWLLRKAYPHAAWHHAKANIAESHLAPEVKAILLEALELGES